MLGFILHPNFPFPRNRVGTMQQFVSDQGGGVTSDETSMTCDRFSIMRRLKGSTDREQRHTGTTNTKTQKQKQNTGENKDTKSNEK